MLRSREGHQVGVGYEPGAWPEGLSRSEGLSASERSERTLRRAASSIPAFRGKGHVPRAPRQDGMAGQTYDLSDFKAPSGAGDWCARCEWAQTCSDCRAGWI